MAQYRHPAWTAQPELHQAVREAFRHSLQHVAYQRQAFEHATEFLRRHEPRLPPAEARLIVARMLATEPLPVAVPANAAILTFPRERSPAA